MASPVGYEIAGGLGIKVAEPDRDVIVMVGDGSYMMAGADSPLPYDGAEDYGRYYRQSRFRLHQPAAIC